MSEISLRDYLAKLYTLLEQQSTDQVILHSRHILASYPRNVTVYRVLGRAMVAGSRWQEAEEIFRRVLSVYPDDYVAHRGMSEVYQHAQRNDEAIWHLERAYEQDPNNDGLIDTLRRLYRDYRNIDQHKVQLTSGAVARQYAGSALYDQAVDTLQRALEREPERLDLRLLMAETLWNSGYHIEAAETAMEVLRVLPECFEANRIMTLLWLGENRPSDAQRFLSRIEDVDPYAALELATGQRPADSAFILEELDYERVSRQEMASARPSWLTEIGEEREPQVNEEDWLGGVSYAGSTQSSASALTVDKSFGMDVPEDWLSEAMGADMPASAEVMPDLEMINTGELLGLDFPADVMPAIPATTASSDDDEMPMMDDLFGMDTDSPAEVAGIGLEDWLAGLDASAPDNPDATIAFPPNMSTDELSSDKEPTKVMARGSMLSKLVEHEAAQAAAASEPEIDDMWALNDSAPAAEQPSFADLLAMDSGGPTASEPDLADMWALDDSGSSAGGYGFTGALDAANWQSGMLSDLGDADAPMFDDVASSSAPSSANVPAEAEDPLAWLRGSDVELSEGDTRQSDFVDDDEMTLQDMDAPSPTAWMAGYGSDFLAEDDAAPNPDEQAADEAVDPLAWLRGGEVEILDDADEPVSDKGFEFSVPVTPPASIPAAQPATNWSALGDDSLLDEALNMESLSLSGDFSPNAEFSAAENMEDVLDWDTVSGSTADEAAPMNFADDTLMDSDYETLTNSDADALLPQDEESWTGSDDAADASLSNITDWQGDMSNADEQTGSDNDQPDSDWLSDEPASEADTNMEWLEEEFPKTELSPPPNKSGLLQWLSGQPPVEGATEAASDEPTPAEPEPSFDFGASLTDDADEDDGGFEWLAGGETESAPAASANSWMSELESDSDTSADDDFSSLFGSDSDAAPASVTASAEDWLPNADLPPAPDSSEYGFTGLLASTSWDQDADEAPDDASADTGESDWLSQLREDSSADEPAPESEFASDFGLTDVVDLSADELDFMNTAADVDDVEEDAPDWLSELQADSSSAPLAASTTSGVPADEFDFMSDSDAAPASEFDFMADADEMPASEFDFISALGNDSDDAEEIAAPVSEFDFMADADAAPADEFDFISALGDDSDNAEKIATPVSADSGGDWLSELRVDSGVSDSDADEEEAISDFGSEISFGSRFESAEDEFGFVSDPDAAPSGDMPDWLSELQADSEAEPDADELEDEGLPEPTASDFGSFGSSDSDFSGDEDEEEDEFDFMTEAGLAPAPADDMPDWLSELQADAEADPDADNELEDESLPEPVSSDFGGFGSALGDDEDEDEFGFMTDADLQPAAASAYSFDDDDDDSDFDMEAADEAEAFAAASGDTPDWLTSMGIGAPADEMSDEEAVETIGGFEWSATDGIDVDDAAYLGEFAEGEELEERVLAQEDAPPPAKNAPDWLNAMVPGLDLDFDAPEDEPIEQEFIEEEQTYRARANRVQTGEFETADDEPETAQDFNWLSSMAEEEANATPAAPPPPDQLPVERRRFSFSKLPLWMRGSNEGDSSSSSNGGAIAAGLGAGVVASSLTSSAGIDEGLDDFDLDFDDDNALDMNEIDDWVKDDTAFPDMDSDSDLDLDTEFGLSGDDELDLGDLDMLENFDSNTSFDDDDDEDDDFGSDSGSDASFDDDDEDDNFDFGSASDFDLDDDDDSDFELPDYLR